MIERAPGGTHALFCNMAWRTRYYGIRFSGAPHSEIAFRQSLKTEAEKIRAE
jgi:hypothetical protein